MPMARAARLCPELAIVPPDFAKYRSVSSQVFEIFRQVTPLVEPLSLDEAYLDVTENAWGEALGVAVARRLKTAIRQATDLTASAGVAPNKFLAKIASGWQKPDGLTVIAPARVEAFLQKLAVDALWGVGPVTAGKLRAIGVERLVDVRTCDAGRGREAGRFADLRLQAPGHVDGQRLVPGVLGDVEVGLVERERLDQRRHGAEEREHLGRHGPVFTEIGRHHRELRTEPDRTRHRHGGAHAERASLVARGGHHAAALRPAADGDRLPAQFRPVALLHGRIEGVHVDVDDPAHGGRIQKGVVSSQ
jgi:hypothetical protein